MSLICQCCTCVFTVKIPTQMLFCWAITVGITDKRAVSHWELHIPTCL